MEVLPFLLGLFVGSLIVSIIMITSEIILLLREKRKMMKAAGNVSKVFCNLFSLKKTSQIDKGD